MRIPTSLVRKIALVSAGLSVAIIATPQTTLAQQSINLQNYESPNPNDPFSQGVEQNNFSMFQLLHNATLGNINENFQPGESITDAVSAFRARQAEAFRLRQNGNVINEAPNNSTSEK